MCAPENKLVYFVFNFQNWTAVPDFTHHAHTASLSAVAVNNRYVVTGSRDETIQIYDMKKKIEYGALLQHNGKEIYLTGINDRKSSSPVRHVPKHCRF